MMQHIHHWHFYMRNNVYLHPTQTVLKKDYILLNNPHIIATPHIGFNTQEALLNKGQLALNNIINFLKKE